MSSGWIGPRDSSTSCGAAGLRLGVPQPWRGTGRTCFRSKIGISLRQGASWEKLEDGLKALGGELSKAIGSILGEMELDAKDMDLLREEQEEFGSRVKQAILEGASHKEAVASAIAQLQETEKEKETRAQLEELTQRSSEAQGVELSGSEIAAIVKVALEV